MDQWLGRSVAEYMPVPWWAWTGKLEREQMYRQLRMMHDQGIREFFIFPIYGMDVEYMSEEYLDRIGWVIEWCRKLGMRIWIYDEYNWPSGMAGGRLARKHPDAVAANIHVEERKDLSPSEVEILRRDATVLHLAGVDSSGAVRNAGSEFAESGDTSRILIYRRLRDQTITLCVRGSPWCTNEPGMLDIISEEACRAFIKEAYEPIARRFGTELGRTIAGFFTDEPQIAPGAIPWTDALPKLFRSRYGYDIIPLLHDLTFDTDTSERTRRDFWALVSEMFSSAYTGQLAEWCEERKLLLTGHMVYEEDSTAVWYAGDIPSSLRRMHVPGCDLLGLETSFDRPNWWYEQWGAKALIRAPKNASSSARFAGRKRVMCEAYGVAPWSKSMADIKRMTDWLWCLGVNLFNDNSLISSIAQFRKRAIAGMHFTQPWWPEAKKVYTYIGRLSAISANTMLDADLLVLYPSTTWWSRVVRGSLRSEELRNLELALDNTLDALVRGHWDFEFMYEEVLQKSSVRDGVLVTEHGSFSAIILAGVALLDSLSAARLEEFAAVGGTIVLVDSNPAVIDKATRREVELPGAVRVGRLPEASFAERMNEALEGRVSRPWTLKGPGADGTISAARITSEGQTLFFVANMTPGDKILEVGWKGDRGVQLVDAESGCRWRPAQSPGRCSLLLPEGESVFVIPADRDGPSESPPAHYLDPGEPTLILDGKWKFRTDRPNLFKPALKLKPDVEGNLRPSCPELHADDSWIPVVEGYAGTPLEPEALKYFWLHAGFDLQSPVDDLHLVADSADFEAAYLNGQDLGKATRVTVWDDENVAWHIGTAATPGTNCLLLRARPSVYNSERIKVFRTDIVEEVALRGSFVVDETSGVLRRPPEEISTGDWRTQGFPHYAGVGIYEKEFVWDRLPSDVVIGCDAGKDLVEVFLDGKSLGKRAWGRRQFMARRLGTGKHRISIRITSSLGSLLRRGYTGNEVLPAYPMGLLSPVTITAVGHRPPY